MNSNLDNDQLFNICAGLFKGFIEWIDVNSQNEKALILDSAYHFKNQILNQENPTLQKNIFRHLKIYLARRHIDFKSMERYFFKLDKF